MPWATLLSTGLGIVGGLLGDDKPSGGGNQQLPTATSTTSGGSSSQSYIDPRMENILYGTGGVIPQATDWYNNNSSGLNDQMVTGMNNSWNQLGASAQGYNQMQNLGMQLMGGGVAGNPFTGQHGIAAQNLSYTPAQMTNSINPFSMPTTQKPAATIAAPSGGGGGGGDVGTGLGGAIGQMLAHVTQNQSPLNWWEQNFPNSGIYSAGDTGA